MDYEIDYENLSPEAWEFLLDLQSLDEKTQTFLIIMIKAIVSKVWSDEEIRFLFRYLMKEEGLEIPTTITSQRNAYTPFVLPADPKPHGPRRAGNRPEGATTGFLKPTDREKQAVSCVKVAIIYRQAFGDVFADNGIEMFAELLKLGFAFHLRIIVATG